MVRYQHISLCVGVTFSCSEFRDNVGIEGSGDTASITAYRVLVSFYGHTSFIKNVGGGVSLLSSRMDVQGNVTFHRNTAVFGAGVAMSGRSLVNGSLVYAIK